MTLKTITKTHTKTYRPIAKGNKFDYWLKYFSQDKTHLTTEQLIEEYIKTL